MSESLWTWGGTYFGRRDGDSLFTLHGVEAGRFRGEEIYGADGCYIGELKNGKLITKTSKSSKRRATFNPKQRIGHVGHVGHVGTVMYAGYEEFSAPGQLPMSQATIIPSPSAPVLPALITTAGERAARRFLEFFTVNIRNKNTRAAYGQAAGAFLRWCEEKGITRIEDVQPVHVAGYIEELGKVRKAPTVKQHLACIRMLFDWLVTGQVVPSNPAHAVRGPRHSVIKGATTVMSSQEATEFLKGIDVSHVVGLRDRAFIGVMVYAFARVSAVVGLKVEDYFPLKKRWWLRLHEKGGKVNEMGCHHNLEEYLDAYIAAAGIAGDKKSPLFRAAIGRTGKLSDRAMSRVDAWYMVRRRAHDAGLETAIGNHSFRAIGITDYLERGGDINIAKRMAGHSNVKTTELYDRRGDEVSFSEIERVGI